MATSHLPDHWIERLCVMLAIDGWRNGVFPHQVVRLFKAWAQAEGGTATWNPLNTTNHIRSAEGGWQDSVDYNPTGVCNYKRPFYGNAATAATLLGGHYDKLVAALRAQPTSGLTAEQIVTQNAQAFQAWGTSPQLLLRVLAGISP